jgi:hypothetical protein
MANQVDLRSSPIFIAYKLNYGQFKYKAALGIENGCSYYTSALIIEGDPAKISDDDIKQLRADLSRALESASGE